MAVAFASWWWCLVCGLPALGVLLVGLVVYWKWYCAADNRKRWKEHRIIAAERDDVKRRREVAFPGDAAATEEMGRNLVGLALSGGGIRSAMFNLGLVQALLTRGLYRYLDYLSAVSGGSYLAVHLASRSPTDRKAPLRPKPGDKQPPRVIRFIRRGDYLARPWEFVFAYGFRLLLNLVVVGSALLLLCTVLACAWRLFDQPAVREWITDDEAASDGIRHSLTADLFRGFILLIPLGLFWFCSWLRLRIWERFIGMREPTAVEQAERWRIFLRILLGLSVIANVVGFLFVSSNFCVFLPVLPVVLFWLGWRIRDETGVRRARRWLHTARVLFGLALIVSVVVLLGNGDVSIGPLRHCVPERALIYDPGMSRPASLDLDLIGGMVRFVLYTGGGIFLGLLLVFGVWPVLRPSVNTSDGAGAAAYTGKSLNLLATIVLIGLPLGVLYQMARENICNRAPQGKLFRVEKNWPKETLPQVRSVRVYSRKDMRETVNARLRQELVASDLTPQQETVARTWHTNEMSFSLGKELRGAQPSLADPELVVLEVRFQPSSETTAERLNEWFDTGKNKGASFVLLPEWAESAVVLEQMRRLELKGLPLREGNVIWFRLASDQALPGDLDRFTMDISLDQKEETPRRLALFAQNRTDIARGGRTALAPEEEQLPGWIAFFLQPPDVLRWAAGIRRDWDTLAEEDQYLRLRILCGSFWVFVVTGLLVSVNFTSMHGFYRERLREHYIVPQPGKGQGIKLSEVTADFRGAEPYPLISATLNLLGNFRSPDRMWPFLFSPRFSGSEVTGCFATTEYLARSWPMSTRDDLAEVAAISGAAVSPSQVKGAWRLLLALANVRLGRWLPNPLRKDASRWACAWRCLLGWFPWPALPILIAEYLLFDAEDRTWCLVTDGGHSENLGLWPLLQRRCQLIIVSDAGQDPEHSFDDFLKVCRRVRLFHGVEILDLHDNRPLDLQPLRRQPDETCPFHFFIGRISYPNGFMPVGKTPNVCKEGYIIYLKPSLTRDEANDLMRHFHHRRPFPHDPTVNQIYDEDTVESYRQLGYHIGDSLCRHLPDNLRTAARRSVDELFWEFLLRGPRRWVEHGPEEEDHYHPLPEPVRDATRRLRRYDTDAVHRQALAEEIRQILARHRDRTAGWRVPAMAVSLGTLVEWAVACNNRALRREPPAPAVYWALGQDRLVQFSVELEQRLAAAANPSAIFHALAEYAARLATEVFVEGGAETARTLVLCYLTVRRIPSRTGQHPGGLLDRITEGDATQLAAWLEQHYGS